VENQNDNGILISREELDLISNLISLVLRNILKHKYFSDDSTKKMLIHLKFKLNDILDCDDDIF
jgi:hypothetical protein